MMPPPDLASAVHVPTFVYTSAAGPFRSGCL